VREPGKLIASGRDGDIFEYGPGLVLRRARGQRVIEHEARIMRFLDEHGYPVPHVHDVLNDGTEIVMERLDGAMLMDVIAKHPYKLGTYAALLADLLDQLHAIDAPDWLRTLDDGTKVLHLDFHPMNVMMTSRGPVVIDWSNAAKGAPLTDVGLTYVLVTCPDMPAPRIVQVMVDPLRKAMANAIVKRYRGPEFDAHMRYAAELKMLDKNMRPGEIRRIRKLLAKAPG
jgi:aminoglycoside phosphotransferase (APT) family kinase protein